MNDLQIFKNEEFGEIRTVEKHNTNEYLGFFYAVEYGDFLKIGSTKHPYQRLMSLKVMAENYGGVQLGRCALSIPHTNYRENEHALHSLFSLSRKLGSELFDISLDSFVSQYLKVIEYKNESEALLKDAQKTFERIKDFTLGNRPQKPQRGFSSVDENYLNLCISLLEELTEERKKRLQIEQENAILMNENILYSMTEIAHELGLQTANALNRKLAQIDVQEVADGIWVFSPQYSNLGYEEIKQEVLDNGKVVYHRRITQLGREFILNQFTES